MKRAIERSFPIDNQTTAQAIIDEAETLGLVRTTVDTVYIEEAGKVIAKYHSEVATTMSPAAKEAMLLKIHLSPEVITIRHRSLLLKLDADPIRKTLLFRREPDNPPQVLESIFTLSELGLIDVTPDLAIVRPRYLPAVNEAISILRYNSDNLHDILPPKDSLAIGDMAEIEAVKYERERLTKLGCPDLAKLVFQISTINPSAGYDILSFDGSSIDPTTNRFIEVKGTTFSQPRFLWSRNEQKTAEQLSVNYWIYIYTEVDIAARTCIGPICVQDPMNTLTSQGFKVEAIDVLVSMPKNSSPTSKK